jgi:hypothetical protein
VARDPCRIRRTRAGQSNETTEHHPATLHHANIAVEVPHRQAIARGIKVQNPDLTECRADIANRHTVLTSKQSDLAVIGPQPDRPTVRAEP